MQITITSTDMVVILDGHPVRAWRGVTDQGVKCCVFVQRIKADEGEDEAAFQRDLIADFPPGEPQFLYQF